MKEKIPNPIQDLIHSHLKLKLSKDELNYLFNLGANKSQTGDHKNALDIYQFLCIYEGTNMLYVKSYAGCLHALKEYAQAHMMYQIAYMAEPHRHQDCLYYMADCAFRQKQIDQAKELLTSYLKGKTQPQLKKDAESLLEGLEQIIQQKKDS